MLLHVLTEPRVGGEGLVTYFTLPGVVRMAVILEFDPPTEGLTTNVTNPKPFISVREFGMLNKDVSVNKTFIANRTLVRKFFVLVGDLNVVMKTNTGVENFITRRTIIHLPPPCFGSI